MARCCECGNPDAHTLMDDDWFCEACLSGIDPDEDYYLGEPSDYADEEACCMDCGRLLVNPSDRLCASCRLLYDE